MLKKHKKMKEPTNKYDFIDGIDLKKIFFKILFNWKTIFITTFLFISLWIVYFINAPRIYDVRSLIQIERTSPFSSHLMRYFHLEKISY